MYVGLLCCIGLFAAVGDDDQLLERAGLPTDAPKLIEHFRRLTPTAADEQAIGSAIGQLTDTNYAIRQQAMRSVIKFGPKAIVLLQKAVQAGDAEAAHRARACLDEIDRQRQPAAIAAAIHRIVKEQPPASAETLLSYAPFAEPGVADELRIGLVTLARTPRWLPVFRDNLKAARAETRAGAAIALIHNRDAEDVELARSLVNDANLEVRSSVVMALITIGDRPSVPILLDLWDKLPQATMSEADDLLMRLAGESAPDVDYGETGEARSAYQKAWREWWSNNGATVDFARLDAPLKVGSSRVDLQACKLEYSIVSPK